MRQPTPQELQDRKPGRSFDDPSRPMGEDTLARSAESSTGANEDFRSREAQADMPHNGVAERAKAIGVLRKAEELIATDNPAATDEAGLRRAFELAAGRVGLTIGEYDALVKDDPELLALEEKVKSAARSRFTG
jgi:hypothetical protein